MSLEVSRTWLFCAYVAPIREGGEKSHVALRGGAGRTPTEARGRRMNRSCRGWFYTARRGGTDRGGAREEGGGERGARRPYRDLDPRAFPCGSCVGLLPFRARVALRGAPCPRAGREAPSPGSPALCARRRKRRGGAMAGRGLVPRHRQRRPASRSRARGPLGGAGWARDGDRAPIIML